jgi:benzoyl-CoA reductase/2-hydroxyglutaryl-CoA dehydratase subunit BcrC/BadD/HgdB
MPLARAIDPKNLTIHKNDLINAINQLQAVQPAGLNLRYFFNLALKFSFEHGQRTDTPQIAIVGLGIPEELIYWAGAEPLWILGGSFGAALCADQLVPRDTDSVSKAAFGYLLSDVFAFTKNAALTVIPIATDSMRKIAYLLSQEREVLALDVPPVKDAPGSKHKWLAQMDRLCREIQKKTKKQLSASGLSDAITMVNQAKMQMKRILTYSMRSPEIISGVLALFLINTYYFTSNLPEWTLKLGALNDQILGKIRARRGRSQKQRPRVMLAGSPVYFPNFKVPLLLQELDVYLSAYAQSMTQRIDLMPGTPRSGIRLQKVFETIVLNHYGADCSEAFVDSNNRYEYMKALADGIQLNGVVYHVLKGQIEYDFELERCEQFFSRRGIPFFRLETDYHQQDIEQLKIRLEAFMEMMEAKYYKMRA